MKDKDQNIPERWHGAHHYSNKLNFFFVFFLIFASLTFLWFYMEMNKLEEVAGKVKAAPTQSVDKPQAPGVGVACTMEAKACPDGVNFVGRTAPYCNFQACPGQACNQGGKEDQVCLHGYHCSAKSNGTCVKD